jgi:hypothetical protein
VTAVGAGVAASLGALSKEMLALYLNERRRRKRIEKAPLSRQPLQVADHYAAENKPSPPYEAPPQDLGTTDQVNELGPRY